MLKVYGIKQSRTARTLWMCRELGVQFEHAPVNFADESTKTPDFLAANPSGKIPAIDDDGFSLRESMAINIYLAKKYQSPLMPKDLQQEAQVLQWSFWVVTEVEKSLLQVMFQRMPTPADPEVARFFRERNPLNPELEKTGVEALQKPLDVLDRHLKDRNYLLGADFTVADLNVASILMWMRAAKIDLSTRPHLEQWFARCMARPAAQG